MAVREKHPGRKDRLSAASSSVRKILDWAKKNGWKPERTGGDHVRWGKNVCDQMTSALTHRTDTDAKREISRMKRAEKNRDAKAATSD